MIKEKKNKLEELAKMADTLRGKARELQEKAEKIDTVLIEEKEKEVLTKMVEEERARQDAKKRTFANPKNADEATGKMPTLEELANGSPDLHPDGWRWKSKEEILESGTLLEKLRLYFSSEDLKGYFGTTGKLTNEEVEKIRASILTKKDTELVKLCYKEYYTLIGYGKQLLFYFKRFQTTYAILATLLNKWESYETTAKQFTTMYGMMEGARFRINPHGTETAHEREKWEKIYTKEDLKELVNENKRLFTLERADLKFDDATKRFWVDVDKQSDPDTGLYNEIESEAKETAEALSDFKAFAVAIEEFIRNSKLQFTPISIQMSIENAEEENYTRYLVKNLSFFRSELNLRKEKGESITPEEEKRAVIPDYYEIEPTQEIYDSCTTYIKQQMSL